MKKYLKLRMYLTIITTSICMILGAYFFAKEGQSYGYFTFGLFGVALLLLYRVFEYRSKKQEIKF